MTRSRPPKAHGVAWSDLPSATQSLVLICHDFVVAGDYTPPNCDNRPAPERWFDR